jgi:hypothetical protein
MSGAGVRALLMFLILPRVAEKAGGEQALKL